MKTIYQRRGWQLLAAVLPLALFAACAGGTGESGSDDPWGNGGGGGAFSDNVDSIPLPSRNENVSFAGPGSQNVDRSRFSPVYFGFDSSVIAEAEKPKIDTVAAYLRENAAATIIIAGFTDAVGTEEYNRQLGEYRALAVRSQLVGRGVAPKRLQTVSFGEDLPAMTGSSSRAHAANRRAEFGLVR